MITTRKPEPKTLPSEAQAEKAVELKPANSSLWYCMATLHGEIDVDGKTDEMFELARKNRTAWHRWVATQWDGKHSVEFIENVDDSDRVRLSDREVADFLDLLSVRAEAEHTSLPGIPQLMNFGKIEFSKEVLFAGYFFPAYVQFGDAKFSEEANFRGAKFSVSCEFQGAKFSGGANFVGVRLPIIAIFRDAKFSEQANFQGVNFFDQAYFENADFSKDVIFANCKFSSKTNFASSRIQKFVPEFRGASLHEATEFHGVQWPSAPADKKAGQQQVYRYERSGSANCRTDTNCSRT